QWPIHRAASREHAQTCRQNPRPCQSPRCLVDGRLGYDLTIRDARGAALAADVKHPALAGNKGKHRHGRMPCADRPVDAGGAPLPCTPADTGSSGSRAIELPSSAAIPEEHVPRGSAASNPALVTRGDGPPPTNLTCL